MRNIDARKPIADVYQSYTGDSAAEPPTREKPMFNASNVATSAVSAPDRSCPCACNETIVQLLATAIATFDSDRDSANACMQRAAELLRVSRNRREHRRNECLALRGGLAPWRAKRVVAYIEANIASNLRTADLAGVVGLSTSHFFRAFKESFGETPLAYITKQRMLRAQLIMLNSRQPLSQIAIDCGMFDQAHLTRVFRKTVGVSPGAWRRQLPTVRASAESERRR
jgi:AraC family transcriptional regulator